MQFQEGGYIGKFLDLMDLTFSTRSFSLDANLINSTFPYLINELRTDSTYFWRKYSCLIGFMAHLSRAVS